MVDRGIRLETINYFKLGFCENSKKIQNKLFENGYTSDELLKSGMYYKKDGSDELVNRFKNRIIFPIQGYYNNFIGCGGRTVLPNALAKYINSPETHFFKKGSNLFNLDKARKLSNKVENIFLVEGYMDVIGLYKNNIERRVQKILRLYMK